MAVNKVPLTRNPLLTIYQMLRKNDILSQHLVNVMHLSTQIVMEIKLPNTVLETLRRAALLHDIGKLLISPTILSKPGRLNKEEWAIMKLHPVKGSELLKTRLQNIELLGFSDVVKAVYHHHEHWDGSGYPDGLAGLDIPLASRIIAVADAFDAMTSNRTYRKALPRETAFKEIAFCTGTQFDPEIVAYFAQVYYSSVK